MSISQNFPSIDPTLTLNFQGARRLDPRINFTRASTATYVGKDGLIKTAVADEARFDHDPATGESLGLLIEESRTNYLGNSKMLANWAFGAAGDTFIASSGSQLSTNPDGSSPAYHYVPSSNAGFHRFNKTVTVPTLDTNYVVSLFVKRVTVGSVSNMNRFVELEVTGNFNGNTAGTGQMGVVGGSAVTFDMENLVIETQTNNYDGFVGGAKIEPYPNGWYRLSYIFNPGIGTQFTGTVWWGHCNTISGDNGGETGNNNPSFYFWGANVEKGSFITSHIPTLDNSSETRQPDNASITGTNFTSWYNPTEGTAYIETILKNSNAAYGYPTYAFKSTTNSNYYYGFSRDNVAPFNYVNTSSTNAYLYGSLSSNSKYKTSLGIKENDINSYINGVQNYTTNSVTLFTPDVLYLGYNPASSLNNINGHIKVFTYYPERLTNAQLQSLTK